MRSPPDMEADCLLKKESGPLSGLRLKSPLKTIDKALSKPEIGITYAELASASLCGTARRERRKRGTLIWPQVCFWAGE